MKNIFYDFETAGLNTFNQILTACFIITDNEFNILEKYNYKIGLNSLSLIDPSALIANQIDVRDHFLENETVAPLLISEEEFAEQVNLLLTETLGTGNYRLCGYNTNKFDIKFLRTLLIKYGYNPYYNYNQFEMIDLYVIAQYLKCFDSPLLKDCENLKLGTIVSKLGIEVPGGTMHEAETDVLATINFAAKIAEKYSIPSLARDCNNAFDYGLFAQDVIQLHNNPDEYLVHDINQKYILLENLTEEKNYPFKLITRNDFCVIQYRNAEQSKIRPRITIKEYFENRDTEVGVQEPEANIYTLRFDDIPKLRDARFSTADKISADWNNNHVTKLTASLRFNRARHIKHTLNGILLHELDQNEKDFFCYYYETYNKYTDRAIDDNSEEETEVTKAVKDYIKTYGEIYEFCKKGETI